jgi:hypothetical protein
VPRRAELEVDPAVRAAGAAGLQGLGQGQAVSDLQDVWRGQYGESRVVERAGLLPAAVHAGHRHRQRADLSVRLHRRHLGVDQRRAVLGRWDTRFDDDYAKWLAALPPPVPADLP